jgi:Gas vesicle synthesis protein GvpL/GvpF
VTGAYLYGIVERAQPSGVDARGLDGTSRVRVVASGDLGAVVSAHTTASNLHALPRESLLKDLVAYQRVVERVMRRQSVLPVRFGTQLQSAGEARDLVSQNRTTLSEAFARMRGMTELEVAATWEIGCVLQEIGHDPAVVSAREAIELRGDPTLEDRLQFGRLVESHIELRRAAIRRRVLDTLEPLASSTATHALVDERLVMNEAFLISAGDLPEFERQVHGLDALFDGQIDFRIVGPLPPYTFCTVEVMRVTALQQEEARRTLGLPDGELDERIIRGAYRRAAAAAQRQLPGDAPAAKLHGGDLGGASELLLDLSRTDPTDRRPGSDGRDRWIAKIRTTGLDDISPASFGGGA